MNAQELLLAIRTIVREEIGMALSARKKNVNTIMSSNEQTEREQRARLLKKKKLAAESNNIKNKLNTIKSMQKRVESINMDEDDEFDIKSKTPATTAAQKRVMESFNKDYSELLKKTGDIK